MKKCTVYAIFILLALLILIGVIRVVNAREGMVDVPTKTALFAGGCFWCMQPPFDALIGNGVVNTSVGYTGGDIADPTYDQVSGGETGHVEAIEVVYDPDLISYDRLLDVYWRNIDPTVKGKQFCDLGDQYRSVIFYLNDEQRTAAEKSKQKMEKRFPAVATEILPASVFYPAEDDHQDYYIKHPLLYRYYKYSCGRDKRLEELWGS